MPDFGSLAGCQPQNKTLERRAGSTYRRKLALRGKSWNMESLARQTRLRLPEIMPWAPDVPDVSRRQQQRTQSSVSMNSSTQNYHDEEVIQVLGGVEVLAEPGRATCDIPVSCVANFEH